ncbi:hypothetical protein KBY66_07110 [Synechococcus sp. Tobar12-5m-g]|jgi:hypothetical protein|uniref:hypothetical protein n=1 Tax=unclassified Synechococcus TaxID=2626047 RepID=UPI0020CDEA3C|nr:MULTISPECIES: hypothetical protein [unclassified Synechococcus]MCP9772394.1 hypothetical protein [Synechococcus sp. Tobar12-5m-g]MCP9873981.1 hypothetical protein [Synechococcus sp. Cruz CV-v-12]
MAPESVSFRITRTAEDLAQTVTALSHRLVRMEQRLGALETAIEQRQSPEPAELEALAHVEVLLRDCRLLLEEPSLPGASEFLEPQAIREDFPNAA